MRPVAINNYRLRALLLVGVALVAGLLLVLTARPAHAATFTVTTTNDHGAGSLRQAIEDANNNGAGVDTINFNIPGDGPHTIAPTSALPVIRGTVIIDGYSQGKSTKNTTSDDATPNTLAEGDNAVLKIELSGANAGADVNGLVIASSNSTVRGLVINRWKGYGVSIGALSGANKATGNKVIGNYIGTDASGTLDLGNSFEGVFIDSANNTVGGTTAAARNVISGNDDSGVYISGTGATGNKVMGNYIGTKANGTEALGNSFYGVLVYFASDNTVGGTTAAARNIISGNDDSGVEIDGTGATGNKVMGNYVGTDKSGTLDLGNSFNGVAIFAPNNTVGGTVTGARNIISGNDRIGVVIGETEATDNRVMGNYIGTDASGTLDLGNGEGVFIDSAPNNTVGGTTAAARNIISRNRSRGVLINGTTATGNSILSNSIFSNRGLGIALQNGGNNLQNFPKLTSASTTTITATLNSTPKKTFIIQFFSNPAGEDEGKKLLGSKQISTDANGNAPISFTSSKSIPAGTAITATATLVSDPATGATGDTSEFSDPMSVV